MGEVVEAGASKNEMASLPTTAVSPVMVWAGMHAGDADNGWEGVWEAGARKNKWGWDICLLSPSAGALCSVMVWDGSGKGDWNMVGG